jgi:hypothetical protein
MDCTALPDRIAQRLQAWRRQAAAELFEQEGLNTLFVQARNVVSGTLILASGLNATHHPDRVPDVLSWARMAPGYAVLGVGVFLLLLNLYDGLRRLARRQYPVLLRGLAAVFYIALTLRLVQVITFLRVV